MGVHFSPAKLSSFQAASTSVIIALIAFPVADLASGSTPNARGRISTSALPPQEVQTFASEVETIGFEDFPNDFLGAVLTPEGVTDVYAIESTDGPLLTAINKLNVNGDLVDVINSQTSYDQLNTVNQQIGAADSQLKGEGVNLSQSWPDPTTGTVQVSVLQPTSLDLSEISAEPSVGNNSVTTASYLAAVSTLLLAEFGPHVSVQTDYGQTYTALDRFNDSPPFSGGDQIKSSTATCTDAFSMTGNASGKPFMLTAGHCGSGTWKTTTSTVGNTSSIYFGGGTLNDFQTIYAPSGLLAQVFSGTGIGYHTVTGQVIPAVGTQITVDGSVTGEVPGTLVTASNVEIYNIYDPVNGSYYDLYPAVESTSTVTTCNPGDSGAPEYQRISGSVAVNAVAVMVAAGGVLGTICIGELMYHIESVANLSLDT